MLRLAFVQGGMFVCLGVRAQQVCLFPRDIGPVEWCLYHPLERGRGEEIAYSIAHALLEDSLVREIRYIHSIRHEIRRAGPWILIRGVATPEGLYALFTALRGAIERFPSRLSWGIPLRRDPEELSRFYRWVYEDTFEVERTVLALNRSFYQYWREGRLRIVLSGPSSSLLLRAARQLAEGGEGNFEYVPPAGPSSFYRPPRHGSGVVYVRWRLKVPPTLLDMMAIWAHIRALLRYLCEERQLACQAVWVPLPIGLELWIQTGLPWAALQASQDFLSRPFVLPSHTSSLFFTWIYAPENTFLSTWWACVWGISAFPKEIPSFSPRQLRQSTQRWSITTFAVGE
ncbi:MAG: hypothetical protein RMK19_07050 [Bacteroidia bacterium]|nr:hypothetical protein [Bacteroidia bacterium]MDW8015753.1 hypothetical protein [Bacteroidia bacterium]